MKIKEILAQLNEYLLEKKEQVIYLYEMSTPLGKVKDNAHNLSKPIFKHLIKCVLYGREYQDTLKHWCSEITNWLSDCMIKIKGREKYPSADELIKWLLDYYQNASDIEYMRYYIENDYLEQGWAKTKLSDEVVYNLCVKILTEACTLLINKRLNKDVLQQTVLKYVN